MSMEIEAKFLVTGRGTYDRIHALTHFGGYSLLPGRMENVHDVYMDTPNRALFTAGYACRRREKDGALVITLKSLTPPQNDVHRREELEVTIPRDAAPAAWPDSAAREKVLGLIGNNPMEELFRLSQSRFVRPVVESDRPVASASLDEVSAGAGSAMQQWCELEVELASTGTEGDLAAIAAWLRTALALRPVASSKFEMALEIMSK